MKKSRLIFSGFLSLLLLLCAQFTFAQQDNTPDAKKKIVIVKKHVDDNGTVTVEKIVREGEEADAIIQEIHTEGDGNTEIDIEITSDGNSRDIRVFSIDGDDTNDNLNIEITDENGNKTYKFRGNGDNGQTESFEWSGQGEIPADVRQKLDDMGIDINSKGSHHRFKRHHGKKSNKAFLGVVIDQDDENGVSQGVLLNKVVKGSAAEEAGLQKKDVITHINGQAINSMDELTTILGQQKPGDSISIDYLRAGNSAQTNAKLKSKASKSYGSFNWDHDYDFDFDSHDVYRYSSNEDRPCVFIGVYISTSGRSSMEGCKITGIIDDTPAEKAQLQANDIITAINDVQVTSFRELLDERNKYNPGDKVTLSLQRDGQDLRSDITFRECENNKNGRSTNNRVIIINKKKDIDVVEEVVAKETEKPIEEQVVVADPIVEYDRSAATLQLENFRAFPNPSSGYVNVRFEAEAAPLTVTVVDISGREIFRENLNGFDGRYSKRIDLSNAAKGTLLLSIRQNDKVYTQAIIRSENSAGL